MAIWALLLSAEVGFEIILRGRRLWNRTWLRGGRWKVNFILRLLLLPCVKRFKHVHCVAFDNRVRCIDHQLLSICFSFRPFSYRLEMGRQMIYCHQLTLDWTLQRIVSSFLLHQLLSCFFLGHYVLQLRVFHKWAGRWFTANTLAFLGNLLDIICFFYVRCHWKPKTGSCLNFM